MIKWSEWSHDYTDFSTGHLHLAVDSWDGPFRWRVTSGANLNYLGTDSVGVADTLDAAKSAAEAFAREWVAAQAAALGDGWVSVEERLPEIGARVLIAHSENGGPPIAETGDFERSGWALDSIGWLMLGMTVTHWCPLPPLPAAEVEE